MICERRNILHSLFFVPIFDIIFKFFLYGKALMIAFSASTFQYFNQSYFTFFILSEFLLLPVNVSTFIVLALRSVQSLKSSRVTFEWLH